MVLFFMYLRYTLSFSILSKIVYQRFNPLAGANIEPFFALHNSLIKNVLCFFMLFKTGELISSFLGTYNIKKNLNQTKKGEITYLSFSFQC